MSPFITLNPWIVETNIQQDTTSEDYVLMIELDGHTKNAKIHLCDFPNYFPLSLCGVSAIDKSDRRSIAPGPEWM